MFKKYLEWKDGLKKKIDGIFTQRYKKQQSILLKTKTNWKKKSNSTEKGNFTTWWINENDFRGNLADKNPRFCIFVRRRQRGRRRKRFLLYYKKRGKALKKDRNHWNTLQFVTTFKLLLLLTHSFIWEEKSILWEKPRKVNYISHFRHPNQSQFRFSGDSPLWGW